MTKEKASPSGGGWEGVGRSGEISNVKIEGVMSYDLFLCTVYMENES